MALIYTNIPAKTSKGGGLWVALEIVAVPAQTLNRPNQKSPL